jgi:phosphatidylserine/phosphatidylglycerophosphate/cardiolipin synthase-like enzyme
MKALQASLIGLFIVGTAQAAAAQSSIDVKRLPVDLNKVTRELRQSAASESHNGLHIRYTIDVYGQAPRIELFTKQDNLGSGPVPYGAPTHREMIDHVTPIEFRAPVMDFSALMRWLGDKANKK